MIAGIIGNIRFDCENEPNIAKYPALTYVVMRS